MPRDRNWSMDAHFINNVNALIQKYVDADFSDSIEEMFKAVKNMEILISPKVDEVEIKKQHEVICWIRNNMTKIFVHDLKTGKVIGVNPQNMATVRALLDETYRALLNILEKEKIYTGEVIDKNKALGYFGSS